LLTQRNPSLSQVYRVQNGIEDVIDIDNMVLEQKAAAAALVQELTVICDNMKPAVDAAKATFKSKRTVIRQNYKKCKKKIFLNKNKWKSKKECAPFAPYLSSSLLEDGASAWEHNASQRTPALMKEDMPSLAFLKEDADSLGQRKRCDKCELRQARRKAKRAAKDEYKQVRMGLRDYKRQLRTAKFQRNVLPKIMQMLKPSLLDALTKTDMNEASVGMLVSCPPFDPLTGNQNTGCVPLEQIGMVDLLRNYMTVELNALMYPGLHKVFKKILDGIWKLVKPVVDSIRSSITLAVGSIPVVGGALAVAVGLLMDALYYALKSGVGSAFDDLREQLQGHLVELIVDAVFATGLFTQEALANPTPELGSAMSGAADTAQEEAVSSTQNSLTGQATTAKSAAEQAAVGVDASIATDGQEAEQGEEADQKNDDDQDDAEESLDIDDEDD
jgi:hypothetical protein